MYKNNQLWNIYFLRSQRISYWYRKTSWCPGIYIIDLNQFLLLFLLTITKQKYFSSLPKILFNYIVFEPILLLVVRPRYSENYIVTISCTWEWASIPQHILVLKHRYLHYLTSLLSPLSNSLFSSESLCFIHCDYIDISMHFEHTDYTIAP